VPRRFVGLGLGELLLDPGLFIRVGASFARNRVAAHRHVPDDDEGDGDHGDDDPRDHGGQRTPSRCLSEYLSGQ
jgi:hypothetical protein